MKPTIADDDLREDPLDDQVSALLKEMQKCKKLTREWVAIKTKVISQSKSACLACLRLSTFDRPRFCAMCTCALLIARTALRPSQIFNLGCPDSPEHTWLFTREHLITFSILNQIEKKMEFLRANFFSE